MKKLLAIVLAVVMVLSLAACGGGGQEQPKAPGHDQTTYVHSTKGTLVPHKFVDGKCTRCEETSIFFQDFMQKHEATKYASSNPGTVVEFHYDSRAYYIENKVGDGQEIWVNKRAYAYLPAGYDESKEYNVVYFLHGSGHDEGYLFARGNYVSTDSSYTGGYATEAVLDYLMDKGLAEKTIVICPTLYAGNSQFPENANLDYGKGDYKSSYVYPDGTIVAVDGNGGGGDFDKELRNHLMPYVAENFATYAKSGAEADLAAARDHVGIMGTSLGSGQTYNAMTKCADLASYFGTFSGHFGTDLTKNVDLYKQYPINYWYVGEGDSEATFDGIITHLDNFIKYRDTFGWSDGSDVANGDNCAYMQIEGGGHNYGTWLNCFFNAMQVFFK